MQERGRRSRRGRGAATGLLASAGRVPRGAVPLRRAAARRRHTTGCGGAALIRCRGAGTVADTRRERGGRGRGLCVGHRDGPQLRSCALGTTQRHGCVRAGRDVYGGALCTGQRGRQPFASAITARHAHRCAGQETSAAQRHAHPSGGVRPGRASSPRRLDRRCVPRCRATPRTAPVRAAVRPVPAGAARRQGPRRRRGRSQSCAGRQPARVTLVGRRRCSGTCTARRRRRRRTPQRAEPPATLRSSIAACCPSECGPGGRAAARGPSRGQLCRVSPTRRCRSGSSSASLDPCVVAPQCGAAATCCERGVRRPMGCVRRTSVCES